MLLGPWPRVTSDGVRLDTLEADVIAGRSTADDLARAMDQAVAEAVAAQAQTGMGLITDGSVRWADPARAVLDALRDGDTGRDGMLARTWRATAELTDVPVAQVVPGPLTLAAINADGEGLSSTADSAPDPTAVASRAVELADLLARELAALAEAGCPVVEVLEPAAVTIAGDDRLRAAFLQAHRQLLARAGDLHAMLAVTGGSAAEADAEVILGAPYASFLFDLIAGPDNWHLVRAAPTERGIVCAALRAGGGKEHLDQAAELVWAAQYAASANRRGLARVGLANASSLADLAPVDARAALEALARAATLAGMPAREAVDAGLDKRILTHGSLPPGLAGTPAAGPPAIPPANAPRRRTPRSPS